MSHGGTNCRAYKKHKTKALETPGILEGGHLEHTEVEEAECKGNVGENHLESVRERRRLQITDRIGMYG